MRQYIRLHAWDFILTVLIAIGMHLNTFSAFMIRESYMTNYLLVAAVTTVVMAVMFVIGYNKRNTIIGGAGWAVFLIGWIIYLRANDLINLEDGADETIPAFWSIVLFGSALIYLLTRSRKILFGAAPIGLLFCAAFKFLEYPVSVPGLFLLIIAIILEILYLVYKDSLLTADYGNYTIRHFLEQSIAVVTVVVLLSSGVFYGIVKPLDPPTRDLKLITKLMSFDILELLGVASTQEVKDPNQGDEDQDEEEPPEEKEEEKDDEENEQDEEENKQESDEKISAQTMSYNEKDYTVYWVTALIILLLTAPFVIKYVLRSRRRRRLNGLDASNQAAFVYDFFLDRLKKLGVGKADSQTILEYAEQQEGVLENFTAEDGTTFEEMTELYNYHLYSKLPIKPEDANKFVAMYDSFYKNAKAFVGTWRYILKFWVL
ncbi:MAG: DUF4129 domain-containing protein [Clostridia bacterium]|nr:DUF4129 domain-containing protein [Clostridia bacterium]